LLDVVLIGVGGSWSPQTSDHGAHDEHSSTGCDTTPHRSSTRTSGPGNAEHDGVARAAVRGPDQVTAVA
jgi:hypothetical protein